MVVCKCRKATKLYCYVHKVPVCSDCICFPEHQLCVRTYSEWVIDGDYEWPPKCMLCQQVLQDGDQPSCRLGCLHILHISCLELHLKSFPSHTAPAGYVCPGCSVPIWPPKNFKDFGTGLPSKLAEAIVQSNLGATLLGTQSTASLRVTPPAFSSDPLISSFSPSGLPLVPSSDGLHTGQPSAGTFEGSSNYEPSSHNNGITEIVESSSKHSLPIVDHSNGNSVGTAIAFNDTIAATSSASQSVSKLAVPSMPQLTKKSYAGPQQHSLARKNSRGDRSASASLSGDEYDDALRKKYSRRGPFYKKVLRSLLPFWSPALPGLPVTAPSRKDTGSEELIDGQPRRRHQRSATIDPRRILLFFAIMSCVATMLLLYYRLLQNSGSSSFE
ncbi:hypothetical protein O6H91_11G076300 [Diphasiastrum complanatum]|uniref:Uncharacterized protein n=1 Tax=Diphasiastrum complanatum TaxID=34168 RepID=A0ACC2CB15_DIPCM|nr:hypothetical protein O6H91_11G076300 [Diphasiastrum complanatum]